MNIADLWFKFMNAGHRVIRGVTDANTLIEHGANCTIATNNVLNAFTPYGDCSLTRIVNLYANITQRYGPKDLGGCFGMITGRAAQVMRTKGSEWQAVHRRASHDRSPRLVTDRPSESALATWRT